jgi:sugar lactone lactonase YvrE
MTRSSLLNVLAPSLCVMLATCEANAAAEEVWALDGFSGPESALHDADRGVIYVANVAGEPVEKNGAGFLSRVSPEGAMLERDWVGGLDAPKGLSRDGGTLWMSDIDRLVSVDIETGAITGTWPAEGAVFLNDTAVDDSGRVFVSDMVTDAIYVLENDALTLWLRDAELQHPNGLKVEGGALIVAPWGRDMQEDFSTLTGGHLLQVDLATKAIAPLGSGEPVGNLDGLERDGAGNWLVTDWIAGALMRIRPDGSREVLVDLDMGSADLGFAPEAGLAFVPMMLNDRLVAFAID